MDGLNKIWIVQRSCGDYEDYHDWVDSAWPTFEEAKKRALELAHYDPQSELDKLPVVSVDGYGNSLTAADILIDGTEFGEDCDEPLSVGKYDKKTKTWLPTDEQKETCVQLVEHPLYFVKKKFLEEYKITVEDADKYVRWNDDIYADEWKPDIIEIEMSTPGARQLTYHYDEGTDDFYAEA